MEIPAISTTASIWIAAGLTAVLIVLHLVAPHVRKLPLVPERYTGSFAGGLAVAYVFLHLLPEIAAGNVAVGKALSDVLEPTPLLDLGIFLVALAGFTAFYGLERLATARSSRDSPTPEAAEKTPLEPSSEVYWLHLGSFMIYNGLITYTMALRVRTGLWFALLFTVAMALHFVLTDRGMSEHYPQRFRANGRVLLAGALFAGWVLSVGFAPTSTLVVALLTALLGGSVLLNVFKEEVPSNRNSSFVWFSIGLVLYSTLLIIVTAISE